MSLAELVNWSLSGFTLGVVIGWFVGFTDGLK